MEAIATRYDLEMSTKKNEFGENVRFRVPTDLKDRMVTAFESQQISQQDGINALIRFFLSFDKEGRAMILGQIDATADDVAMLILRRIHQQVAESGTDAAKTALSSILKRGQSSKGASA